MGGATRRLDQCIMAGSERSIELRVDENGSHAHVALCGFASMQTRSTGVYVCGSTAVPHKLQCTVFQDMGELD